MHKVHSVGTARRARPSVHNKPVQTINHASQLLSAYLTHLLGRHQPPQRRIPKYYLHELIKKHAFCAPTNVLEVRCTRAVHVFCVRSYRAYTR